MKKQKNHPYIPELIDHLNKGSITRREFIRYSALLGMSVGVVTQIAGVSFPKPTFASGVIKRGGTLRVAASTQKFSHPSQIGWSFVSNQVRQVAEYLTYTDANNITHPYLLENWKVSDDLKTWTLNLRKGVKFNNGEEFVADDVIFTMNQWLNKDVGSSLLGMIGPYLDPTGIEKTSTYQVKLNLKRPEISVPEHLFHYVAFVLNHRTFEGDFTKRPHGTGPYTLELYRPGEICVVKRRNDYWQNGTDGKSLPYMDGIKFIHMGEEMTPNIAALRAGEIDMIDLCAKSGAEVYLALKDDPRFDVQPIATGTARVIGMRADVAPWSDYRVRQAMKLCQQREKLLQIAYFGQGVLGADFHVYPKHPEYCEKPIPQYNPKKAKALLREAGYPNGVDVTLSVGSGWKDIVRMAEILKEDAAPAGLRIKIETMPNSQYWQKWTELPFKITNWQHRPLASMVMSLAYIVDEKGKPVKWNETKWVDQEFCDLLTKAGGTSDLEERKKIFCKIEDIQMTRGTIAIPFFKNVWLVTSKDVKNAEPHPSDYMLFNEVWLDKKEA